MTRHNNYSNVEMRDMACVYAQENYNGRQACQRYFEMYPNRQQPNFKTVKRIYDRLGEIGSFQHRKKTVGRPRMITPEQEEEILEDVVDNPEISTRRRALAARAGVSQKSVVRIFHEEKLYPYHFTPVQNLCEVDLQARLQFCNFFRMCQCNVPLGYAYGFPLLYRKGSLVLFTDEATFTRRGVINHRNKHAWDTENPHLTTERHFQHEFKINVWCRIIDNYFVGPYVLPPKLNGPLYLEFLQNELGNLLDDVPLNLRQVMFFMQDGAPAHFSRPVRDFLSTRFANRCIGRGFEIPWPPRSPDFNPMDFCVWGYVV
ncbi:uncharacterized protein [Euwallacea fornicatus]|uniref:uncharacterized protein n=1 Tax=Euwallacea fornicatus TaxID=995702 RepID=UPI00338DF18C